MAKIGLFTFGGGYAMIALLENEFVRQKKWLCKDEFLDMVAIAESTPGPIAVNAATYIGYKMYGLLGAVFATLAICLPSFTVIYAVSLFFDAFLALEAVKNAFCGIQVCVIWLILSAGLKMLKSIKRSVFNILVFSAVLILSVLFFLLGVNFSSVLFILISGALGVSVYLVSRIKEGKAG